ncbi:MAG: DUF2029 domain-containing protein [Planctomycetes bacterium]|nr:DUF2029 domain-containing protein [Planctomycetota bacterium]
MRAPRVALAAAWCLLWAAAVWLIANDSLHDLESLGVPVMAQRFADVYPVTGASVALERGLDPLADNPGDPWGRALNYPRIWLLPALLGVGPQHSDSFAIALLVVFAASLLLLLPLATTPARSATLALCLFSPVTWLAIERANSDMLVFALLAASAWALAHRPRTSAALVGTAAVLKLYPIFALGGLLGLPRRTALWLVGSIGVAFLGYLLWIRADLAAIQANSLAWNRISYGITQLPDAVSANTGWPRQPLLVAAFVAIAITLIAGLCVRRRWTLPTESGPTLHAFRIGAGVFVGTFCLGSNFDYRLLCLLPVVPQLVDWCATTRGRVRLAVGAQAALIPLLLWSMTWRKHLAATIGSETPGLMLDEVLTWLLVFGLLATLVLSLPAWLLPRWSATPSNAADGAATA